MYATTELIGWLRSVCYYRPTSLVGLCLVPNVCRPTLASCCPGYGFYSCRCLVAASRWSAAVTLLWRLRDVVGIALISECDELVNNDDDDMMITGSHIQWLCMQSTKYRVCYYCPLPNVSLFM